MPEFKMFTELCKSRKLNPFLREAYIIKFGTQPAQIVVGKDAILKRAILNKNFNGREQGIIVKNENGIEERKGTFRLKDEVIVGGWAKVYRKDWDYPVYITVSFDEVAQRKKDGGLNSNWATKSATMVEKVALVRALREAFVEDLGGMIDEDEAWSNEDLNRQQVTEIQQQNDPLENNPEAEVIEAEEAKF
jgi:phage recombination protein Bet